MHNCKLIMKGRIYYIYYCTKYWWLNNQFSEKEKKTSNQVSALSLYSKTHFPVHFASQYTRLSPLVCFVLQMEQTKHCPTSYLSSRLRWRRNTSRRASGVSHTWHCGLRPQCLVRTCSARRDSLDSYEQPSYLHARITGEHFPVSGSVYVAWTCLNVFTSSFTGPNSFLYCSQDTITGWIFPELLLKKDELTY